jgi:hypothetical protein
VTRKSTMLAALALLLSSGAANAQMADGEFEKLVGKAAVGLYDVVTHATACGFIIDREAIDGSLADIGMDVESISPGGAYFEDAISEIEKAKKDDAKTLKSSICWRLDVRYTNLSTDPVFKGWLHNGQMPLPSAKDYK